MKSSDSSSKKLQPSSSVSSVNKLSLNGRSNSVVSGKNAGEDSTVTELLSPLEIPGLLYLIFLTME